MSTPEQLVETYFDAWRTQDAEALRGVLSDDVRFAGPMATLVGVDSVVPGLMGLAAVITRLEVVRRWTDGPDVATWFELSTTEAGPLPTVNWSHVADGRIAEVRVAFDPRPLLG